MTDRLRVLTVCTHNRTRSVFMAALLDEHLTSNGVAARVLSVGLAVGGQPAMSRTVSLLDKRGIDVSRHRSTQVDARYVRHADLVLCAEHEQVLSICGAHPDSFRKCFTLPEVVRLGEQVAGQTRSLPVWLDRIAAVRVGPLDYLSQDPSGVGEIADPTGESRRTWNATFQEIDDLTSRLAVMLRFDGSRTTLGA